MLKKQYDEWVPRAERQLVTSLDAVYAIQFKNAPALQYGKVGMAIAGMGYWQDIKGKVAVLNSFLTELRAASR
jgi:hypothetical protein